uniref:Exocyst complex component 2 n=1 Tax=Nothobranchius furzeri TaxID=105023 RepID=A0A8C6NPA6_NOTFU
MSRSRQPPLVTGISPKEGTAWTKVTIRGENLGTGPADLVGLSICGHNCMLTAEWMSASKIVCRVGPAKDDKGEIIVTTKSGGLGTSTVSFKLLRPDRIGILEQSAVWVDEINYDMRRDRNKGLSPLSLGPSNPLGIEIDKYGSKLYQHTHTHTQPSNIPQKDLELVFPGMSGDFTSENFAATCYLIENHAGSSFEHLKLAASNLRKQATKKNEGSLGYVKGGLSTFFEAQDALSVIHQKLESDGTEKVAGSMTQQLEDILNRASDTADTLFQEVLGRKDKADSTRNALNVLQRFKFLFNLPLNIERNIQKVDYDYWGGKELFVVLRRSEKVLFMSAFIEKSSRCANVDLSFCCGTIPAATGPVPVRPAYLSDLHAPGDPAWKCIDAQHKRILQLMQNCRDGFINVGVGALDLEGDTRPSALSRLSHSASLKRGGSLRSPRPSTWRFETPPQVQFVEKLSDVVIGQLPNFWKLWISYVNGSLFSETGEKSGQVEKSKKNARQRQNDFKRMIEELTSRLVKFIRGALLPTTMPPAELSLYGGWEDKAELTGAWLTQIIHIVRACHEALSALEIPNDLLQVIQDLLFELRVHCLMMTLLHTTEDVKRLAEKEDWVVDNEGITSLVRACRSSKQQIHETLPLLLLLLFGLALHLLPATEVCTCVCLCPTQAFINCLEQLSTKTDGDFGASRNVSVDLSSPDRFVAIPEGFSPTSEQRLLIILSNCQYLERRTFLNLADRFEKHGFTGTEKITQVSVDAVRELDRKLFEAYIERRADPIAGSLEPGIYAGYFDWRDCQTPAGVRDYLKEALVNIIAVHAEVFTVSKDLVPRVLSKIVESVAEEMCRLMQCVSSLSKNGALQVHTDMLAPTTTHTKTLTHSVCVCVGGGGGDPPAVSYNATANC